MKPRRVLSSLLVIALALSPLAPAGAQEATPGEDPVQTPPPAPEFNDPELDRLWQVLMTLRYDTSIRVDRHSIPEPMGGHFQFATEYEVVVDNFGQEVRVPFEDVSEIWREDHHKGRSLLIGTVLGLVSGVAITALVLNNGTTANGNEVSTGSAIFMGGVAGAALGITLGGLIGGEDQQWVREYP